MKISQTFETNTHITTLLATTSDIIIFTDSQLNINFSNKRLYDFSGYDVFDLQGKPLEFLWVSKKESTKLVEELASKKKIVNQAAKLRTKTGIERDVLIHASAVFSKRRLIGFVFVLQKISDPKSVACLDVIRDYARFIAHDMRPSLQCMRNAAFLLRSRYSNTLDSKGIEFLNIIDTTIIRTNETINNLIEYSEELNLFFTQCNLKSLIDCAISDLKIPKNITIHQQLHDIQFCGDKIKLQRVFSSVIKNSIEAMPSGGIIQVNSCVNQRSLEVIVRDTGVGISESILMQLFQPLSSIKASGFGLGLAMCRRILDGHGGTISVLSTSEDDGTAILVTLPMVAK